MPTAHSTDDFWLRQEGNVRNWPKVGRVFEVKSITLESRKEDRSLLRVGKNTFLKRPVAEESEERE